MPLWGISLFLIYALRRVNCPRCGVTGELVPWGEGKRPVTRAYAVFLARWARRLSWKETASIFKTSWETVYRSVAWVVECGLEHRSLDGVTAIGVDEVQFQKGHRYLTVMYRINEDCRSRRAGTVDLAGSNGQDARAVLQDDGAATHGRDPVRLQRHVEAEMFDAPHRAESVDDLVEEQWQQLEAASVMDAMQMMGAYDEFSPGTPRQTDLSKSFNRSKSNISRSNSPPTIKNLVVFLKVRVCDDAENVPAVTPAVP